MHVNVRTAACNRASPPRKKNAVHEHAEPQSEREHPRPRRAARRRCSARSSTTSGRARRAATHDQLERKPRPRGFHHQLRSPSERSDRKDKDSRSKRHRGLQRTCHVRAAHTHIHDNTNKCVCVCMRKKQPAIKLHRTGQGELVTDTLNRRDRHQFALPMLRWVHTMTSGIITP